MSGDERGYPYWGDPSSMDPGADPVDDPELQDVALRVAQVLQDDRMRPSVRDQLRAQLVAAAAEQVASRPERRVPAIAPRSPDPHSGPLRTPISGVHREHREGRSGQHRGRPRGRVAVTWLSAAAAAVVVVAVVVQNGVPGVGGKTADVQMISDAVGKVSLDPTSSIQVAFSVPLDHATVAAAMHLTPAADVQTSWSGNTMKVTARHGLAPNTGYLMTISHQVARTTAGAALASDLQLIFGTAPQVGPGPTPAQPAELARTRVAPSVEGAEAVITTTGTMLLTAAKSTAGGAGEGLYKMANGAMSKVSVSTDAICVSRSGQSVAFLKKQGNTTQIAMGDANGNVQQQVPASVDQGSPLGWIGDSEVSFVSGGRLKAVDRSGKVRTIDGVSVDAARDTVVIAPGGRFLYLAKSNRDGSVIDLITRKSFVLPGINGAPAFSADGATVVWVQGSGSAAKIATAPSAGGPFTRSRLPVQSGDTVSNLAVNPDGSRLVYSVKHADGTGELRLASLPDGNTLAVSKSGIGESPNWSPSGQTFAVLAHRQSGPVIQQVNVPSAARDAQAAFESLAQAFANAQVSGDVDAQRALAGSGVTIPALPRLTRSALIWVQQAADGTATARVRLCVDPSAGQPAGQEAEETLTLSQRPGGGAPIITGLTLGSFGATPNSPQLTRVDSDAQPNTVLLSFDSDLNPASVPGSTTLVNESGARIPASVTYDAKGRTIVVRPSGPGVTWATVVLAPSLRDVSGRALSAQFRIPVHLAAR